MIDWVMARHPERIIDAGCGTGRFAGAAVRRDVSLPVVAIDLDPLATLLTRATLAVLNARNATVLQADYTRMRLPPIAGRTGFIGNPPYVRHHDLSPELKAWAFANARRLGRRASGLAGLHSYFFLSTALNAKPGDIGCFVTSAEWLDVNYGSLIRGLFLDGLGGRSLHVIRPQAVPFADAMTTAAIACFEVGSAPAEVRLHLIEAVPHLRSLDAGDSISRAELARANRWTPFLRRVDGPAAESDFIPLGALVHVHRGAVTGANGFFVLTRERANALGIDQWCRPVISRAEEIFLSGGIVRDSAERKVLLDLPPTIDRAACPYLDAYLRLGEQPRDGQPPISEGYIARHRQPWWVVRAATPPVVATYMARQPPAFALNPDRLAIINIAHGLYPRVEMTDGQLTTLVDVLNQDRESFRGMGRTYHGGLEKFEPREMEGLPVPARLRSI
jgi:hypothetical protein